MIYVCTKSILVSFSTYIHIIGSDPVYFFRKLPKGNNNKQKCFYTKFNCVKRSIKLT